MMAESLPFCMGSSVHTWELEAWYEDLEEVLSLDVTGRTDPSALGAQELEEIDLDDTALLWDLDGSDRLEPSGNSAAENWDLSSHLSTDLLDLLGEDPAGAPESDSSRSSPPQTGTDEEVLSVRKRKRSDQPHGSKRRRGREREQQDERRVEELMAQNKHLQQEIERLTTEVETTRAALVQRMVNLKS